MMSARRLRWFGSRCCTTTNAMPVLAGNALKNSVYASNPPADAPIATTGKESICAAAFDAASAPAGEDADSGWRAFISAPDLLFPAPPRERNVLDPISGGRGTFRGVSSSTYSLGFMPRNRHNAAFGGTNSYNTKEAIGSVSVDTKLETGLFVTQYCSDAVDKMIRGW